MKVYNVEVLFTAEKKMQVLAKNEEEAKAKVRKIYATTNLLDVHPGSMILEDPLVYEADDIDPIMLCPESCSECLLDELGLCNKKHLESQEN